MISSETIKELLRGKSSLFMERVFDRLAEKTENRLMEMSVDTASNIMEMTDGHKEMMKQYLDNISVVDLTPKEKDGKGTIMKTQNAAMKKTPQKDCQDDYSEVGGNAKKIAAANYVSKTVSQNKRELRSESLAVGIPSRNSKDELKAKAKQYFGVGKHTKKNIEKV